MEEPKLLESPQAKQEPQKAAAPKPEYQKPEQKKVEQPRKRRGAMVVVLILGVILAIGGFMFWQYSLTYESTDDAEVDAHLSGVGSRIQGTVLAVYTDENQFVKEGQVVAEIDPRDYRVLLEQTRADVKQAQADIQVENPNVPITQVSSATTISTTQADIANAEAGVAAAEADVAAAQAKVVEAEANNNKAQADVTRYKQLVDKDEISHQQFDQVVATAAAQAATVASTRASVEAYQKVVAQRRAQLDQARSRAQQANSNAPRQLAVSRANVQSKVAAADAAQTRVDQALLNLSYTKVLAPVDGVVSKRSVEVGNTVQAGQQLFSIAALGDIWVTANFKETQLKRMSPGQRATIRIDAFGQDFSGHVESLPAASGAVSSLLPPENATGNFVKVVQRLPVRIRFDKNQSGLERLRPGMSAEPKVWLQ
jgi:membrane fusion protein (multidrug efflux system)